MRELLVRLPDVNVDGVGDRAALVAYLDLDSIRTPITKARPTARFGAGPPGQFVPDHID